MYYLVAQWTEKGIEAARLRSIDKVYGTREKPVFIQKIWEGTWKVISEPVAAPCMIRAFIKAHRKGFFNSKAGDSWSQWLNGIDSKVETLNEDETCRFFG
jgi:hypothetical protein